MLTVSLTEVVFNLATTLTAAIIPNSDKILRKASVVLIKMVGLVPDQSSIDNHCQNFEHLRKAPKVRRRLQIHRQKIEESVRSTGRNFFASKSYQNFLQYHQNKYRWHKSKFSSLKNKKQMLTIHETEEL